MFKKIKSKITIKNYIIAVCSFFAILALVSSLTNVNPAKADESEKDYSFYKIASAAATYFNESQSPEGDGLDAKWTQSSAGASLLGFPDSEKTQGVVGWLSSKLSTSSITYSYSALTQSATKIDNGFLNMSDDEAGNGMLNYALYGAALNGLGLDSVPANIGSGFGRKFAGFLMYIFFGLAASADVIMSIALNILKTLNPFQFFGAAIQHTVGGSVGTAFDGAKVAGPFSGLVNFVNGWYSTLYNLSWVVIFPVFVAIAFVTMLMFKKTSKGSTMKKLIIRLSFGILLFPLVGSTYTLMLNKMADMTSEGSLGASQVVMSTFVDFERWASEYRLAKPSSVVVGWNNKTASPTIAAQAAVRSSAFAINAQSYGISGMNFGAKDNSASSVAEFNKNMTKTTKDLGSADTLKATLSIIDRYAEGSKYEASDWETAVKGAMTNGKTGSAKKKDKPAEGTGGDAESKGQEFLDAADVEKYKDGTVGPNHKYHKVIGGVNFSNGGYFQTSGGKAGVTGTGMLSHIGMYNYLSTDFGKTNMVVYSAAKSSSQFIKKSHYSVNLVGTGAMKLLYFLNALSLLICFTVLGVSYGFGLVVCNLRRGISMIASVPFAMLGSIRYITRVFVYTSVMIIEIVGTFFLYLFAQSLLLSLPQVVEVPIAGALNKLPGLKETAAIPLVMATFSLVILIMFTYQAIKMRKYFIRSADEAMKGILESFFGVNSGVDLGSANKGSALKSGLKGVAGGLALGAMTGGGSLMATAAEGGLKGLVAGTGDEDEDDENKSSDSSNDKGGTFEDKDDKDSKGSKGPKGEKSDKDDTLGSGKKSAKGSKSDSDDSDSSDDEGSSSGIKTPKGSKSKKTTYTKPDKNGFRVNDKGQIFNSDFEMVDSEGRRISPKTGKPLEGEIARPNTHRPTAGTQSLSASIIEDNKNKAKLGSNSEGPANSSEILAKAGYVIDNNRIKRYNSSGDLVEDYPNSKAQRGKLASSIVEKQEAQKAVGTGSGSPKKTVKSGIQKNIDNMVEYAQSGDLAKDIAIGYMTGNVKGQVAAGALKNTEQGKAVINRLSGSKTKNAGVGLGSAEKTSSPSPSGYTPSRFVGGSSDTLSRPSKTQTRTSSPSSGTYNNVGPTIANAKTIKGQKTRTNVVNENETVFTGKNTSSDQAGNFVQGAKLNTQTRAPKSQHQRTTVTNTQETVHDTKVNNVTGKRNSGNGFTGSRSGVSSSSISRNKHTNNVINESVDIVRSTSKVNSTNTRVSGSTLNRGGVSGSKSSIGNVNTKGNVSNEVLDSSIKTGTKFIKKEPKKK